MHHMVHQRIVFTVHTAGSHDDGIAGQGEIPFQYHLFPDDRGLALGNECAVGAVRERGERLLEGGVGRVELLLGENIVSIAVGVELVSASAKVRRGQVRGNIAQERGGEVDHFGEREAELARGRLVGILCPRRRIEACNVVGVGLSNDGGVSRRIDFLRSMSARAFRHYPHHTYHENINTVLRIRDKLQRRVKRKGNVTYRGSVLNDVLHVTRAIRLLSGVGAIHSKPRILRNLERETLTVGDVPMEGVDLDPTHGIERPHNIGNGETIQQDDVRPWLKQRTQRYAQVPRCVEHKTAVGLQVNT